MAEYIKKDDVIKAIQNEINLVGADTEEDIENVNLVKATFKVAQNVVNKLPVRDFPK